MRKIKVTFTKASNPEDKTYKLQLSSGCKLIGHLSHYPKGYTATVVLLFNEPNVDKLELSKTVHLSSTVRLGFLSEEQAVKYVEDVVACFGKTMHSGNWTD